MIRSISLIATNKPASSFAVSLSQYTISATASTNSIQTGSVTASATGGTAPYTYAWSNVGGDSSISAASPTNASTAFRRGSCVSGNTYTSTWVCTVTDATTATATSAALQVSITRT